MEVPCTQGRPPNGTSIFSRTCYLVSLTLPSLCFWWRRTGCWEVALPFVEMPVYVLRQVVPEGRRAPQAWPRMGLAHQPCRLAATALVPERRLVGWEPEHMGREVREACVVPRPWAGWTQSGPLQLVLILPLVTWGLSFLIFQVVVWNTDLMALLFVFFICTSHPLPMPFTACLEAVPRKEGDRRGPQSLALSKTEVAVSGHGLSLLPALPLLLNPSLALDDLGPKCSAYELPAVKGPGVTCSAG